MRFLLYNIRYGTGGKRPAVPLTSYLRRTEENLSAIAGFIQASSPDIIGLLEVDAGSYRSGRQNQAKHIAEVLGHCHVYQRKYGDGSMVCRLPLFKNQGNAFIVRNRIRSQTFHYFNKGMKKLVIELQLEEVTVFLVHLALGYRTRKAQLKELAALLSACPGPHILAGDFNLMWGRRELTWFLDATGLQDAGGKRIPTFPSRRPRRQLDYILHSPAIRVTRVCVPQVSYSDHLPLICDFAIENKHKRVQERMQ